MDFCKKLQELRKKKGLTQEELAEALYVSRAAVSKWESGRGYPSIESIKELAKFFSVTVDDLLSSDEVLNLAEEDTKKKELRFRSIVFGLLDVSVMMLFFIPFFGQKAEEMVQGVSLLSLSSSPYLCTVYYVIVVAIALYGILSLVFQDFWFKSRDKISLFLNAAAIITFIVSLQPYAATLLFVFLIIKVSMLIK